MVYEPAEDSFLLVSSLPSSCKGLRCLEIGCGSGVVSVELARRGGVVVAVDFDQEAVAETREAARLAGVSVEVVEGDLFERVRGPFDLVVCNPPYLPADPRDPDVALDGGVEGWEFIGRFLEGVRDVLAEGGRFLLLFSSRSGPGKVRSLLVPFRFRVVAKKSVGFFEELEVVEAWVA